MELSSSKLKKLLIFQERIFQHRKIKKTHYEKNLLYFLKKSFPIIQEMELSKPQDSKPYILGGNWLSPKKQIFLVFWGMELFF